MMINILLTFCKTYFLILKIPYPVTSLLAAVGHCTGDPLCSVSYSHFPVPKKCRKKH